MYIHILIGYFQIRVFLIHAQYFLHEIRYIVIKLIIIIFLNKMI